MFNLSGEKWKSLRTKMTPAFTPGKMKMMFPVITNCGKGLQDYLEEHAQNNEPIDVRDLMARFTTDVIATCAFGIATNSLTNPESEFRIYGRRVISPGLKMVFIRVLTACVPFLSRYYKV